MLNGKNFQDGTTDPAGRDDDVNGWPLSVHPKSRFGAYWPYVASQGNNLTLQLVLNEQWVGWFNLSLEIPVPEGSSIVIVPLSASFETPYTAGLVYQRMDGVLAGCLLQGLSVMDWNIRMSAHRISCLVCLANGSHFAAPIELPPNSSFGAFAVAAQNDSNSTDTYIIYKTASNDFGYIYNSQKTWKTGPASDALRGVDTSTDIACLTEGIWQDIRVLSSQYDMSRCYFLTGGRLKEVSFDGANWTDQSYIPLT